MNVPPPSFPTWRNNEFESADNGGNCTFSSLDKYISTYVFHYFFKTGLKSLNIVLYFLLYIWNINTTLFSSILRSFYLLKVLLQYVDYFCSYRKNVRDNCTTNLKTIEYIPGLFYTTCLDAKFTVGKLLREPSSTSREIMRHAYAAFTWF